MRWRKKRLAIRLMFGMELALSMPNNAGDMSCKVDSKRC